MDADYNDCSFAPEENKYLPTLPTREVNAGSFHLCLFKCMCAGLLQIKEI
jgi:hypothetical protein